MSNTAKTKFAHESYPNTSPQAKLLVAVYGDGHIVFYGDRRRVQLHITSIIDAPGVKGELMAEEYAELTMPCWARDLYWPGMVLARSNVQRITPVDVLEQEGETRAHKALDDIIAGNSGEVVTCLW